MSRQIRTENSTFTAEHKTENYDKSTQDERRHKMENYKCLKTDENRIKKTDDTRQINTVRPKTENYIRPILNYDKRLKTANDRQEDKDCNTDVQTLTVTTLPKQGVGKLTILFILLTQLCNSIDSRCVM